MYRSTTKKLFISNLPKEYSVDLLLRTISNWTEDVPNLQIISNKKNPDNGLAILCSVSQEQSIILKQKLPKKQFQGQKRYRQFIKKIINIKRIIYLYDKNNRFRGKAKLILFNYNDLVKLLNYPQKISFFKRNLSFKFYKNKKYKNNSNNNTNNYNNKNYNNKNYNNNNNNNYSNNLQNNNNNNLINEINQLKIIIKDLAITIKQLNTTINNNKNIQQFTKETISQDDIINKNNIQNNNHNQNSSYSSQVNFENIGNNSQTLVENDNLKLDNDIIDIPRENNNFKKKSILNNTVSSTFKTQTFSEI
ncbi:hypothetical protein M0812_00728 [Anaeramoeba flamelloides]|uniref:RRM domain-containing protein n=1 Tax=Anaeramoeba flamelloides TaxID=1746091 RepID=A0AAV8A3T6_9EUKA|nr:hypothetical protein M0812_00728 [Anaeramoeba flamelloides]